MKKMLKVLALILILAALVVTPVLAYSYTASIIVIEDDMAGYTELPIIMGGDNQFLADNSYMTATGLDTRILKASLEMPHMIVTNKTLFTSDITQNSQTNFNYTFGNTALDNFNIVIGYGGHITVPDVVNLELGDSFEVEVKGYIKTTHSDYVNRNLVYKANAFKLYISAEGSIKAEITGGNSVTATGIDSGDMTIVVSANGIELSIQIDTDAPITNAVGFAAVPDVATDWLMLQNDVMPYAEYIKIRVG